MLPVPLGYNEETEAMIEVGHGWLFSFFMTVLRGSKRIGQAFQILLFNVLVEFCQTLSIFSDSDAQPQRFWQW